MKHFITATVFAVILSGATSATAQDTADSAQETTIVAGAGKFIGEIVKDIVTPVQIDKYSDDVDGSREAADKAVSYTHLTLPTICSV